MLSINHLFSPSFHRKGGKKTYLGEANILRFLAEALTADVEAVFPDQPRFVRAYSAVLPTDDVSIRISIGEWVFGEGGGGRGEEGNGEGMGGRGRGGWGRGGWGRVPSARTLAVSAGAGVPD